MIFNVRYIRTNFIRTLYIQCIVFLTILFNSCEQKQKFNQIIKIEFGRIKISKQYDSLHYNIFVPIKLINYTNEDIVLSTLDSSNICQNFIGIIGKDTVLFKKYMTYNIISSNDSSYIKLYLLNYKVKQNEFYPEIKFVCNLHVDSIEYICPIKLIQLPDNIGVENAFLIGNEEF